LILVYIKDGSCGVRGLLKRAFDYRIKSKTWYVPVLCLWPAAMFLEYGLMYLMGATLPDTQFPALMVPIFLVLFFVTGTCEELGWQGYAFDRLYGRWNAVDAGLILGAVWAAWHVVPLAQSRRGAAWIVWQCIAATIEVAEGQKVVSTGPYAVVRHPMYAGGSLYLAATPPALGSYWGLLAFAGMLPFLIWRLLDEERFLAGDLPGYREYRRRVRHRLVPSSGEARFAR
jgi:protein-S-isoprenylcysteine O-methyltransferase Ste14